MKNEDEFQSYFLKAQELSIRAHHDVKSRQELLNLIENERKQSENNSIYDHFLQGEYAFYTRKYALALKCYIKAGAIPYYKLFCYRTSSFISRSKGEIIKSINFAKQALNVYPYDYITLTIYEELLTIEHQNLEANHIRQRLQALEAQHDPNYSEGIDPNLFIKDLDDIPYEAFEEKLSWTEKAPTMTFQATIPAAFTDQKVFPKQKTNTQESTMHIPPGFLASADEKPSSNSENLTQRLYSQKLTGNEKAPFAKAKTAPQENKSITPSPQITHPTAEQFAISDNPKKTLEDSITRNSNLHQEHAAQYLAQHNSLSALNCLYLLHGRPPHTSDVQSVLLDKARKTTGGYYLRWNGKGIVINPGANFLHHFHQQGLHLRDVDMVIVTSCNTDAHTDVKEICELNYQLNKISKTPHVIHYYLSSQAFQLLSPFLKPHFKQERHSIHRLELFLDSPEGEKIELSNSISLHYFPIGAPGKHHVTRSGKDDGITALPSSLGLRFDLHSKDQTIHLGYVSSSPWSPMLSHAIGSCDILIAGFGSTNANDYNKLKYNEDCLGYFGCYSLLEEVHPRLLVCSEFNGQEGDIRLDVVKMMRQEYLTAYPNIQNPPTILPADSNLFIELSSLHIYCSITKEAVPAQNIRVSKSAANFGALQFLSPNCCS